MDARPAFHSANRKQTPNVLRSTFRSSIEIRVHSTLPSRTKRPTKYNPRVVITRSICNRFGRFSFSRFRPDGWYIAGRITRSRTRYEITSRFRIDYARRRDTRKRKTSSSPPPPPCNSLVFAHDFINPSRHRDVIIFYARARIYPTRRANCDSFNRVTNANTRLNRE